MTYSIVARDPASGRLGMAVATCTFAVGTAVPAGRAGVGVVATQAMPESSHRASLLELLARGASAGDALVAVRADDEGDAFRQTAVVDGAGRAAACTGDLCIDHAGHHVGDGYAVQANMMASPGVWPAMAVAYEGATGTFERRLFAALLAAEAAGGDARGTMSAAMLVVAGTPDAADTTVDLRVDATARPLDELDRLLVTSNAYAHYERAVTALFGGDVAGARAEADAAQALLPTDGNLRFVQAGALVFDGRVEQGLAELRALVQDQPSWAVIVRSFVSKGLFPVPPGVDLDAVLGG